MPIEITKHEATLLRRLKRLKQFDPEAHRQVTELINMVIETGMTDDKSVAAIHQLTVQLRDYVNRKRV